MASRSAIGIMRESAINRMTDASNSIASELGVIGFELPTGGRDADYLHAQQLSALADFLDAIVVALETPKPTTSKKASKVTKANVIEEDESVEGD